MELSNKQKKILELLEKEELPSTKIAYLISSNLYQTEDYLNELLKLNLIIFDKRNNATYWKLNKKEEKTNGGRN